MIGEIFKVLGDHAQRALEDGVEDFRNLIRHRRLHLVDDGGEERQHLGVSSVRNVSRVITQNWIVHLRYELLRHQVRIVASLDEGFDESEHLALDGAQELDEGRLARVRTALSDALTHQFAVQLVHVEDVGVDGRHLVLERLPQGHAQVRVRLENVEDIFDDVLILQALAVLSRLGHDLLPRRVGRVHQTLHVLLSLPRVHFAADHVTDGFVKSVYLVRFQVSDGVRQAAEKLVDEGLLFADLQDDKFALTLRGNLQESVARHVLHPRVRLVHEFKQLVHHRLKKLPVQSQKPRVLSYDVHDVGGDDGFLILHAHDLAQVEQIPDRGDQESVLLILLHRTADRTDRPAERVERVPRVFATAELGVQLFEHLRLGVLVIEMREVNQSLAHDLVLN